MSNDSCDTVFKINQILPNVANAINGEKFDGLKLLNAKIDDILKPEIRKGLILIFSENKIIDILYKNNVTLFLKDFKSIINEDTFFIVIYDIENVSNQEIALKMVKNYLQLILGNCD